MKLKVKLVLAALTVMMLALTSCRPPEVETAVMEFKGGRYENAVKAAEKSVKLYPDNAEAWWFLGISKLEVARTLDDYKSAKEALDKAKELDPQNYGKKVDDMEYYHFGQNYNASVKYYNKGMSLAGTDSADLVLNKVIEKAEIAAVFQPTKAPVFTLIARSYDTMKKTDEAGKYYKKAYEIAPDSISTQFDYGYYLFNQKKYEEAIKVLEKVAFSDRKDEIGKTYRTNAFALLESAYAALEKEDKVRDIYEKHLEFEPNNAILNFNMGLFYYQDQKMADAEKYFVKAIELDIDNADAYLYLGNCRNILKKYEEARQILEEGVKKYPDNAEMWNQLGQAYAHLNMAKEADKAYKTAKKLQ